jgi:hypothetical protein
MRGFLRFCSVAGLVLLVIMALGPESWQPRTGLQAFTPDRTANVMAALYGAGGALAAALIAELFLHVLSYKVSGQGIFRKRGNGIGPDLKGTSGISKR